MKIKIAVVSGVIRATESESEESERFHFLPTPLTTPSLTFRLWSSENQIVRVGSRSRRISQSQCKFPRFVIGLVLLRLLPTPTIWFSLDHKRNVSNGVVSAIGTLFSLDHKLYASDYDSDSVASENQPLLSRNAPLSKFVSNSSHFWMNAVTAFSSSGEIRTEIVTALSFLLRQLNGWRKTLFQMLYLLLVIPKLPSVSQASNVRISINLFEWL